MRFFDDIAASLGGRRSYDDRSVPARPSIPPLLVLGLSLWGSCAAVWAPARCFAFDVCVAGAILAALAALASVVLLFLARRRVGVICLVGGCALGCAVALCGSVALQGQQSSILQHPRAEAVLTALEDVSPTPYGAQGLFEARFPGGDGGTVLAYLDDGSLPLRGERVVAEVEPEPISGRSADWAWAQGQIATVKIDEAMPLEREDAMGKVIEIRSRAIQALRGQGDHCAVLQALVCGYTVAYDGTFAKQEFTACGLAHIVAVSGAHLVIVGGIVGILLRALRLPRGVCAATQCALMLFYLVLAGIPVSAVRAFVMAVIAQVSYFARRRNAGLAALGGCVGGMVVFDPVLSVSASFALSALSTLGIALFGSLASSWLMRICGALPEILRDALALTFASSLLAQPYSCALFSQLPLVSPIANAFAAPLVAPVCATGILAALSCVFFPAFEGVLVGAAQIGSKALCSVVSWCSGAPYASVPVVVDELLALAVSAMLAGLLWRWWPAPPKRIRWSLAFSCAALLVAAFVGVPILISSAQGDELVMLDVGQGDAFLIRSKGASLLVDTGASDALLRSALARQGVRSVDAIVISHADDDHCGALASLRGTVSASRVIVARDALSCPCEKCADLRSDAFRVVGEEGLCGVEIGDSLAVGAFDLQVIWPERFVEEGGNADSLSLLLTYPGTERESPTLSALLVGDAEAEQLDRMMEEKALDGIDILKVGHHGSRNALTPEQVDKLDPALALVSVGEGNRYGHPATEVLDLLGEAGTTVMRTDERGDVSCRFSSEGIRVRALR